LFSNVPAPAPVAKKIHEHTLFGEVPKLHGDYREKSKRLSDQVEVIKEQAYQDGYQEGHRNGVPIGEADGRRQGRMQAEAQAQIERQAEAAAFGRACEALTQEFEQMIVQWFENTEQIMANMAMEIVRRIVAAEVHTNPETALNIAREVLQHITHAKTARIHINPNDFALFESHREVLRSVSQNLRNVEIVEDSDIRSGIVVETEAGLIDATIDTRLSLIENEYDQAA
jgi:flagellar assembly protein FliH